MSVAQIIDPGWSSRKYLSLSFDLSHQSEQCDWLRIWLKSKLRLKYFQELRPWSLPCLMFQDIIVTIFLLFWCYACGFCYLHIYNWLEITYTIYIPLHINIHNWFLWKWIQWTAYSHNGYIFLTCPNYFSSVITRTHNCLKTVLVPMFTGSSFTEARVCVYFWEWPGHIDPGHIDLASIIFPTHLTY